MKGKITTFLAITGASALIAAASGFYTVVKVIADAEKINCTIIGNYSRAQEFLAQYIKDPVKYKKYSRLDADHDGIACESLKGK